MPNPFESSSRKLDRAKKHFDKLVDTVRAFVDSEPYHSVIEPHPNKPSYEVHKIKPTRELRRECDDIGDVFGEFVDNLRSALDNAAYAIAAASGKPDAKNAYFPFAGSINNIVNAVGRCADLPEEIQSLFIGFQPYRGGDDLLYAVNEACNADKHKTVVPAFNVFVREGVSVGGTRYFEMPLKHTWDSVKDEMVLVTLGPGSPEDFKYDFQFTVFVAIDQIEAIKGKEILGTADALGGKVEGMLRLIEYEAKRLKIVS